MNKDRKYMIVTKRHEGAVDNALLFWGHLTGDNDKRSFGTYTVDIEKCEKYTKEELKQYRKGDKASMPFFNETDSHEYFIRCRDLLVTMDELEELGYRKFTVMA